MASVDESVSTFEISPLSIRYDKVYDAIEQQLVCSASSILHSASSLPSSAGDIITSIVGGAGRKVIVERTDGTRIASFDLPPLPSTSENNESLKYEQVQNVTERWKGYCDPVICWASFKRHDNQRSNNHSENNQTSVKSCCRSLGRKMLCVLGNPTTLLIFDVLGDAAIKVISNNKSTQTDNYLNCDEFDDEGESNGPSGYTIPLPFQARAIYNVDCDSHNDNNEGLIILRAPSNLDYGYNPQEANIILDSVSHSVSSGVISLPATPKSHTGGGIKYNTQLACTDDNGNNDSNCDEFQLQEPPEPVRLNFIGKTLQECERECYNDFGVSNNGEDAIPSLFSLCHPLDEIRPVAVDHIANNNLRDESQRNIQSSLFFDVTEMLVYVGLPRLFGVFSSGETAVGNRGTFPICVTYNSILKRHAVWSLSNAVSPVPPSPLWKTTGRGRWRADMEATNRVNIDCSGDDNINIQQFDCEADPPLIESVISKSDLPKPSHSCHHDEDSIPRIPSSFSDIHPDFVMSLLHEEQDRNFPDSLKTLTSQNALVKKKTKDLQSLQRHVFLVTDVKGRGDLVLCIFMPNSHSSSDTDPSDEPAILRCFSLDINQDNSGDLDPVRIVSVNHLVDIKCSSAQPIQSIPCPLAPFLMKKRYRRSSRFQSMYVNTIAYDILLSKKNDAVAEDENRIQTGNDGTQIKLSLCRSGVIYVLDLCLPKKICNGYLFIELMNSVEDRIDIVFMDKLSSKIVIMRASISLSTHSSPITEMSLRAIESSLVYFMENSTETAQEDNHHCIPNNVCLPCPINWLGASLALLIRADCVSMCQRMKNYSMISKVEDPQWYFLTVVLLDLLLGVNNNAESPSTLSEEIKDDAKISAWNQLLQSDFHAIFSQGEGKLLFSDLNLDTALSSSSRFGAVSRFKAFLSSKIFVSRIEKDYHDRALSQDYKKLIFDSLHLLHEDARLVSQSHGTFWIHRLGTLLLYVTENLSPLMVDFEDHYRRHLGNSRCLSNPCSEWSVTCPPRRITNFILCPCIMTCLDCILHLKYADYTSENVVFEMCGYHELIESGLNGTCSTSWMVLRLFMVLFNSNSLFSRKSDNDDVLSSSMSDSSFIQCQRDREVVLSMLHEGIYHFIQLQDELPIGVTYPLLEAIHRCRFNPPQINSSSDCWPTAAYDLVGRNDLAELSHTRSIIVSKTSQRGNKSLQESFTSTQFKSGVSSNVLDFDGDGLVALENYSSMIFPGDNRIREAARLLRSSRTLFLSCPRPVEMLDHDYERCKQDKLLLLCRRSIALPLGRGMLTLGTHHLSSAEQLIIPSIVLAGRVPPTNGTLALDMSSCPTNFRVWPEFHNGVAAGLRLPGGTGLNKKERIITRTWIKYNRPVTVHHSGSSNTSSSNPPNYSHGGFLMALGLRGHLSVLTTTDLTDYLTQGTITTTIGIFLGMAANKRGSCDPSISKMLCLHIPSLLPPSFIPMDIASTVQAAAVAGIGLLYQGSAHRLMTEFLLNEIGRQPAMDQNSNDREGFALVCGLALGMVNLQKGTSTVSGLEDLRIEERLQRYIFGCSDESIFYQRRHSAEVSHEGSQVDADRNARSIDPYSINRDITAPGATLALGLMYMKSHNISISSSLKLPDTHFLLDYVRPDLLSLRVLSRSLILWNDVQPSHEWIDLQIPSIVKKSIEFMKNAAMKAASLINIDDINVQNRSNTISGSDREITDFDPQAIRQANAFIIAGACFSLGLKYAGSANNHAASAIFQRVVYFSGLRDNKDVVTLCQKPDTSSLVTCLCTAAISLSMVMAGTGDLDSFRLLRALRWRCDEGTLYGTHMAFNAAIGLLFLGGGKCTLGSSSEDVAMLIAAFFPHFPVLSSDNQYHLQALRHLYVLAVHERILEAVDVDSGEKVCLPMELTLAQTKESVEVSTPYLLSNELEFTEMRSKSDRYYPVLINTTDWSSSTHNKSVTLFVKRKPGHLSYLHDPYALHLFIIQTGSLDGESLLKSISLFSEDTTLISFAKYFCTTTKRSKSANLSDDSWLRFCFDITHECMREEKSSMISYYLNLFKLIQSRSCQDINIQNIWDARLLRSYVERKKCWGLDDGDYLAVNLLSAEFITLVCQKIDDLVNYGSYIDGSALTTSTLREAWWKNDNCSAFNMGHFWIWNNVPKLS